MITKEDFQRKVLDSDIFDQERRHHELSNGLHGRKLDFEKIQNGSQLFDDLIELSAREIEQSYISKRVGRIAIVGVADGANRFVDPIATALGGITGLQTAKDPQLRLTDEADEFFRSQEVDLALVLEDVGTTGSNSFEVLRAVRAAGVSNVEVLNLWQRTRQLPVLDESGIRYKAVINRPIRTLEPEDCRQWGYCHAGWELIEK